MNLPHALKVLCSAAICLLASPGGGIADEPPIQPVLVQHQGEARFEERILAAFLADTEILDIEKKTGCLDTTNFEHRQEYFFVGRAPFVRLGNGNFVVVLTGAEPSVYLYGPSGAFLKQVARDGQGPGEVMAGSPLLARDSSCFYVVDPIEFKISRFSNDGIFLGDVRNARRYAPGGFAVSPVSDAYYFYNSYDPRDKPLFTCGNMREGMTGSFGKAARINRAAEHAGDLTPLTVNEQGTLFAVKPEEYGFEIYSPGGTLVRKVTGPLPHFWQPVSEKEIKQYKEQFRGMRLPIPYLRNTRAEQIFYLGDDVVLVVYMKWHFENSKKKLTPRRWLDPNRTEALLYRKNLELWTTDGRLLGSLEIDDQRLIEYAENGRLYFWYLEDKPDSSGIFPNPRLVTYDLFKDAGLR